MAGPKTLFDKLWESHVVADLGDGFALIFIDRHIVHDLSGRGFVTLNKLGLSLRHPELTFATSDHSLATMWDKAKDPGAKDNAYVQNLRDNAQKMNFKLFDVGQDGHGITHVISPEQGLALPGTSLVCGDSHACTIGALDAMALGIGQTELVHVMATQTSVQRRPKNMRITLEGKPGPYVSGKDLILYIIGQVGAAGGQGHAVELTGPAIRELPMEGRFTMCNMAVEFGARFGLIAPDETTLEYVKGRAHAPTGAAWDQAVENWKSLITDDGAVFDKEVTLDISDIGPQVTWGTSPQDVIGIGGTIPEPASAADDQARQSIAAALDYTGLEGGAQIEGTKIDWVFIGSCTNSRISDLRAAAEVAEGRHVADGVTAWVVPGSNNVRTTAEAEGLDKIFLEAGFGWGEPGCSLCGGHGNQFTEKIGTEVRAVTTTNRNFRGRHGPGSRAHLASPVMAVAAAINGHISDVRKLGS